MPEMEAHIFVHGVEEGYTPGKSKSDIGTGSTPGAGGAGSGNIANEEKQVRKTLINFGKEFKKVGALIAGSFGVVQLAKSSTIISTFVGSTFRILSTIVDLLLLPLVPILVPFLEAFASSLPYIEIASKAMSKMNEWLFSNAKSLFEPLGKLWSFFANPGFGTFGEFVLNLLNTIFAVDETISFGKLVLGWIDRFLVDPAFTFAGQVWEWVKDYLGEPFFTFGAWVWQWTKDYLGEPLFTFAAWVWQWVKDYLGEPLFTFAAWVWQWVKDFLIDPAKTFWNYIEEYIPKFFTEAVPETLGTIWDWIRNAVQSFVSSMIPGGGGGSNDIWPDLKPPSWVPYIGSNTVPDGSSANTVTVSAPITINTNSVGSAVSALKTVFLTDIEQQISRGIV